jgi:hypothetical protein
MLKFGILMRLGNKDPLSIFTKFQYKNDIKLNRMTSKNLSELSERELEHKEKILKNSLTFITVAGLICTLIVLLSSYIFKQPLSWWTLLFAAGLPLYSAFDCKKQLNTIKSEFERRRYR